MLFIKKSNLRVEYGKLLQKRCVFRSFFSELLFNRPKKPRVLGLDATVVRCFATYESAATRRRSASLSDGQRAGEKRRGGTAKRERERWRRQRAEARRTRVSRWQRDEGWRRVGEIAGRRTGREPSAGSTFIHKTKAESDKERIVSGIRTITGSANALSACQRRRERGISATRLTRLLLLGQLFDRV